MDVPSQDCITTDNVTVSVDGILYIQVIDSKRSAYGIDNYKFAAGQLAQTSLRSVIGKIELDRTFEERDSLNQQVVPLGLLAEVADLVLQVGSKPFHVVGFDQTSKQ